MYYWEKPTQHWSGCPMWLWKHSTELHRALGCHVEQGALMQLKGSASHDWLPRKSPHATNQCTNKNTKLWNSIVFCSNVNLFQWHSMTVTTITINTINTIKTQFNERAWCMFQPCLCPSSRLYSTPRRIAVTAAPRTLVVQQFPAILLYAR